MKDLLAMRYQQYFRHPDNDHDVLEVGDRAIACANLRRALPMLRVGGEMPSTDDLLFDEALRGAVREFQSSQGHRVADGRVGPGTRERLVSEMLHRFSPSIFARLRRPEIWSRPAVFTSHASADREKVNKLDQWLRDHGLRVVRDCQFFIAGDTIQDNIARAIAASDKILAVLSVNSRDRDWPRLERELAEQVEARLGASVLIYVSVDDVDLPAHDPTRLAIRAKGKALKDVGAEILNAVVRVPIPQWQYTYDEDQSL
jgi:peptidoglycan hydrolase-like protein with peptidoglycan-binding domain